MANNFLKKLFPQPVIYLRNTPDVFSQQIFALICKNIKRHIEEGKILTSLAVIL